MIHALTFHQSTEHSGLREAAWVPRSAVSIKRACELANALATQLAARFGCEIEVMVHEPLVPTPALVSALLAEAELYEVDAEQSRAWIFLDGIAARRLVTRAFAEQQTIGQRPWSLLERGSLDRIIRDIADVLNPLWGAVRSCQASCDHAAVRSAQTLLAVQIGAPFEIEIDVALAHDPGEALTPTLEPQAIEEVELTVRAIAGHIRVTCAELGGLQIGTLLPMSREGQAQLVIDQTEIARGACGIIGGQLAFRIGQSHESQGA